MPGCAENGQALLIAEIREALEQSGKTYGNPRIHVELRPRGAHWQKADRPAHARAGSDRAKEEAPAAGDDGWAMDDHLRAELWERTLLNGHLTPPAATRPDPP